MTFPLCEWSPSPARLQCSPELVVSSTCRTRARVLHPASSNTTSPVRSKTCFASSFCDARTRPPLVDVNLQRQTPPGALSGHVVSVCGVSTTCSASPRFSPGPLAVCFAIFNISAETTERSKLSQPKETSKQVKVKAAKRGFVNLNFIMIRKKPKSAAANHTLKHTKHANTRLQHTHTRLRTTP